MTAWTEQRVLRAAADWVWVPRDARVAEREDYLLVAYPEHYAMPTQVLWSRTGRPVPEVAAEVLAQARRWGRSHVDWWTSAATRPAETARLLRELGAEPVETVEVLAYDMSRGLPVLDPPQGVRAVVVTDAATLRAWCEVNAEVWAQPPPDDKRFAATLAEVENELATGTGCRVVAFAGEVPVSAGGGTVADGAVRLWGAGTRTAWRRRGCYRRVLAERMRFGRERGATLALVKGRVATSAPILLRAGFGSFGHEHCLRLPVPDAP